MNFIDPRLGPLTALVTAFLSAVMAVLDAFNVFHFNDTQRNSVLALAVASIAVGLYLFAILHQQTVKLKAAYPAAFAKPVNQPVVASHQMKKPL